MNFLSGSIHRLHLQIECETIQSSQLVENAVHRPVFAPANEPVVAQVEQVSEQAAAPVPLPNTTIVERAPSALVSGHIQIGVAALSMLSSTPSWASRGES